MEYTRNEFEKIIDCPVYNKRKTIFIQTMEYNGVKFVRSNGCDDVSAHPKCIECLRREFNISDIPSQAPQEPS